MGLPYIDFVGFWLNLERQQWQAAGAVMRGIEMAVGPGDLPAAYFDAVTPTAEAAEAVEWDVNTARHAAQHWRGKK